jgi:hypothetical protein
LAYGARCVEYGEASYFVVLKFNEVMHIHGAEEKLMLRIREGDGWAPDTSSVHVGSFPCREGSDFRQWFAENLRFIEEHSPTFGE